MKKLTSNSSILLFLIGIVLCFSCDENETGPSYQKLGKSYSTIASATVAKTNPTQSENVNVTIKYVNYSSDPLSKIIIKHNENGGAYSEVTTLDQSGANRDSENQVVYSYNVSQAPGTKIIIQVELYSKLDYPMVLRTATMTVQ
jgi:hypothetical protein